MSRKGARFLREFVHEARAVIATASKLLAESCCDAVAPRSWMSADVAITTVPLPEAGVVLTARPRVGWAGLLRGASVLLRPPADSVHPVRFGVLDDHGQLRVQALAPVPHEIVLHAPWWYDDHLCAEVRDGNAGPAWIATPVVVLELPELESEVVAVLCETQACGAEWRYLSATRHLRYTIRTLEGELQVDASLRADQAAGQAAVCYGLLSSPSLRTLRRGLCSTEFDQRHGGWWRADPMRCRSVLMLGAQPQPAPGLPVRRVALDTRVSRALGSDLALQRQAAAAEISGDLSRVGSSPTPVPNGSRG